MATTITLKNLPDDIYERLKESAKANHRSINSEVIACLEKTLLSAQISPQERLDRARQLRKSLKPGNFNLKEIPRGLIPTVYDRCRYQYYQLSLSADGENGR